MSQSEISQDTTSVATSGSLLKEARLKANLSVEEVANRLRLHRNLVVALEADDEEQLPSTVFVLGYLRKYAKLLGVPADKILAANPFAKRDNYIKPPPRHRAQVKSIRIDPQFALSGLAILLLVLLLAVAGVLYAWWQGWIDLPFLQLSESEPSEFVQIERGDAQTSSLSTSSEIKA